MDGPRDPGGGMRALALPVLLLLLLLVASLAGCPGDDDDSAGDDDAAWPERFAGTLTARTRYGDAVECDATVELVGTRYSGACAECDFAFAVVATVVEDQGTDDCLFDHRWSYLPDDHHVDLVLAHAPTYTTQGWYGTYAYSDALLTGYTYLADDGTADGPRWWALAHAGSEDGTLARTGDAVAWTLDLTTRVTRDPYRDECGEVTASDADQAFGGEATAAGEMACGGEEIDVWAFAVPADGAQVTVTVDTVDAAGAFDPRFYVNDPDGCTFLTADDSFECTFPPPAYRCPAASFEARVGTYQLVVQSAGSCAGELARYAVAVDVPAAPGLSAVELGRTVVDDYRVEVDGAGTLVP